MKVDFLIVGAGLAGCVIAERITNVLNKSVLLIDKRPHVGGNIYDYPDKNDILIHKYGPHAFHTSNKAVWDYLSNFTDWHCYFHKVKAVIDGMEVPVPFNLNSINQVFPLKLASKLEDKLINNFGFNIKIPILKLKNTDDADLKFLADYVYNKVFLGYTMKQWGLSPEQLDESVTSRIPVYISRDDRYFQDKYQGIPLNGYTALINNIINNKLINVELNSAFNDIKNNVSYKHLIFTGPIDEYFNFKYGELPYRSLSFKLRAMNTEYYKATAQTNYPENYDFTRITEFKHFLDRKSPVSPIAFEYPEAFNHKNEPYYPIPNSESAEKYQRYEEDAKELSNITFLGRLAEYKYYNMDQIVERTLKVFDDEIKFS